MLRFHGLFAPNAAARSALAALVPKPKALTLPTLAPSPPPATDPTQDSPPADTPTPVPAVYRRPWAELLKRVLDQDALRCPRCHQRMVPIQNIDFQREEGDDRCQGPCKNAPESYRVG